MTGPMTLQEIADHFGVSRQAVAETLNSAYRKIRKALKAKGIYTYSDVSVGETSTLPADHEIHEGKYK